MSLFLSSQALVVVSADCHAISGKLYCYERSFDKWRSVFDPIVVNLGKNGMAHEGEKREGDGKSPSGIFPLGPVFGDSLHKSCVKNMPFLLTKDLECVDDSSSLHYNQFVTSSIEKTYVSSEKMEEMGSLYSLGVVVGYNQHPVCSGVGSCIFLHIWKEEGCGTAGCTVMEKKHLVNVVSWLDAKKTPHLAQFPMEEYEKKKNGWAYQSFRQN